MLVKHRMECVLILTFILTGLVVFFVGGTNITIGVINNICSHEHPENTTLGTSTLELQNTTINVIWSQADFTELYLVLQKVKELRKNHADLVYVNSTDHSIVMAISNLNSTPALHLNDVNQETVENLVAPESYSPCQETPPKVEDSPTVACSAVAFGKNIFDEFGITLMVSRILKHAFLQNGLRFRWFHSIS